MDCSVQPSKKYKDLYVVSTTDFFFPLVDDPYIQGKIACANVLSDMYALGVDSIDSMLMLLAASLDVPEGPRFVVTRQLIRGFSDLAREAGVEVTGGQTVLNPWTIIGGVAKSVCKTDDFILPRRAEKGNVLVLTKPLGTQIAVNVKQWLGTAAWDDAVGDALSPDDAETAFLKAQSSMARLNRTAARLMHQHRARAATDVTGFGILGHLANLAENQTARLTMVLDALPMFRGVLPVAQRHPEFKLLDGYSAETSGGILVCLENDAVARAFCDDILRIDGQPAWIVGRVLESDDPNAKNSARIVENPTIIQV
mmetsp:Transcript_246/g.622  ORF Transcript_246/g.622 Transcript_246/m.622 type:complete len:312 (-) Transcript_246:276-1211(-)